MRPAIESFVRTAAMLESNSAALKEWVAVCAALTSGRTSLLLRKGGLHEPAGGLRWRVPASAGPASCEFWLWATEFHQSPGQLTPAGAELLGAAAPLQPPPGLCRLPAYAVVDAAVELQDFPQVDALTDWHVLAPEVVRKRFEYRQPGLWAVLVRVYAPAAPLLVPDLPRYAGCRSWVELELPVSTAGLTPVLPEHEHADRRNAFARWTGSPIRDAQR